jgi:phage/plasmid-associated DNA primase
MLVESHGVGTNNYGYKIPHMAVLTNEKDDPDAHSGSRLALRGKRFVYGEEPNKKKYSSSFIKTLFSGSDYTMSARAAYARNPVSFRPQFRLMVSQNPIPEFDTPDNATQARITIYGYHKEFVPEPTKPGQIKADRALAVRMKTKEYQQQLVLMGLKRCREILITLERMPVIPESVKANTREIFEEQDEFAQFIKENVKFTDNPTHYVKITKDLLPMFKNGCQDAVNFKQNIVRILGRSATNKDNGQVVKYANTDAIKGAQLVSQFNRDNMM